MSENSRGILASGGFILLVLIAFFVVYLAIAADAEESKQVDPSNGALNFSVEQLEDRQYHCFTYTTVERGGLWCKDVTGDVAPDVKPNGSIRASVEEKEGHKYHCFAYTTVKRGGLWCQSVEGD